MRNKFNRLKIYRQTRPLIQENQILLKFISKWDIQDTLHVKCEILLPKLQNIGLHHEFLGKSYYKPIFSCDNMHEFWANVKWQAGCTIMEFCLRTKSSKENIIWRICAAVGGHKAMLLVHHTNNDLY